MTTRALCVAMLFALAPVASGCDDLNLPKSWAIAYPRLLAMRSEVVGDEGRATPEPGERVRLRILIVGPKPIERVSYALRVCPARQGNGGVPGCAADPIAEPEGAVGEDEPFDDVVAVELDLPDDDGLDGVEDLLVIGTACTDGDARPPRDEQDPGACEGGDEPALTWTATLSLARAPGDHNQNPVLADDAIAFDDQSWPPASAEGDALAVAPDGELHTLQVNLRDSGRERVDGEPETLVLSHFTTAGPLQRRFSVLESDEPADRVLDIEWHSPHPPPGRKLPERVRMVFVLRDERGGVDYTIRELAVEGP